MNFKKHFLLSLISLCTISAYAQAKEVQLNLQQPAMTDSAIEIRLNKSKISSDLIKLITLEGMSSTNSVEDSAPNKRTFAKYFLSGDDKFVQANITSAYSDYTKAINASGSNDFQSLLLAYKLANIGFFTLSQQAVNQINDIDLYKEQTNSIKNIFYPEIALNYDEEILLAELYADIYYNNLAKETTKELSKHQALLKKSDYANYIMAQAFYESGELGKAMHYINKALNIKKNSLYYAQFKAKILCEAKNYSEALKILNKIQSSGFLIDKFKRSIDIQREFTLANSLKDASKSKYHLANYFFLIGEYNRALKEANNSLTAKKRNYETLTLIGNIQAAVGEYEKAKESYNKALSINKKYAPAFVGLGNIEKLIGTYEQTLSYYNQSLKYDKTNLTVILEMARILNLAGNSVKAKEICAYILSKSPESSDLYYSMAEIYPENQHLFLRKALSINAFNNDAWIDLAEINLTQNNVDLAEKYLITVKVNSHENYKYYYVEGLINKYHANYSAAAVSFKKSLKLNPNYTPAEKELNTLNL